MINRENLPMKSGDGPEESNEPSFFQYLQSKEGHELATRILTLIEEVKKATLDKSVDQSKLNMEFTQKQRKYTLITQSVVIGAVIVAASILTWFGKLDATMAFLFGTLAGYFFGRKTT